MIEKKHIIRWFSLAREVFEENKDFLTQLDAAIGDADHGINMNRGFTRATDILKNIPKNSDVGEIVSLLGVLLISNVGGAAGPLYGSFFTQGAKAIKGKTSLDNDDIQSFISAGVMGVVKRGKADVGDKTMLDVLIPAEQALTQSLQDGKNILEAVTSAVDAAEKGVQSTIPMEAKKGRACYLGERSIGHQDPGATSSFLLLKALLEAIK